MSKDDQIQALNRRNKRDREKHARDIQAKNEEIRTLRDSWELLDTYPNLENFLRWLHKIRDAAAPLRSPTYQPGKSADTISPAERGAFHDRDRSRLDYVNRKIAEWTKKLEDEMSPKGPLVDEEIPDVSKPRCFNPECPARFRPQSFDLEICVDCKQPFTEFRDPHTKCWKTECAEKLQRSRGHLGPCPD